MPELPEVETIRRSLAGRVVGRHIAEVQVRQPKLRRTVDADLDRLLVGRRIVADRRRGKYLLFDLDDGLSWILHLGMSGCLLYVEPGAAGGRGSLSGSTQEKHDHVCVGLDDGGRLLFNDPRRFGLMVVERADESPLLATMGPDAWEDDAFDGPALFALGKATRRCLKDVLMDQRVVAGLGNIYVNEILFRAGLRPRTRLSRLSRQRCEVLATCTRTVLAEAIEHRGSTVSDFLDGIGKRGGYQWHHNVYDRAGQPCPRCETAIKAVVVSHRSSFYCPSCQA